MSLAPFKRLLGLAGQAHHVQPPGPADERVVIAPLQVRRALNELARLKRPVALQAANGLFVGSGHLSTDAVHGVTVHLFAEDGAAASTAWPWPVNATASAPDGLLLFTLLGGTADPSGRVNAAWPDQLIRVQSRRHTRLSASDGMQRRAWVLCRGMNVRLAVRDLSEGGVCIEVGTGMGSGPQPVGAAQLHLDGVVLDVPVMAVVHTRVGRPGEPTCVGASLAGLGQEALDVLRCWMLAVQAAALLAQGDQA